MKHTTIILLGILLILVCSASAAPTTYVVATTPLYASSFSTLTCNYIANDSLATVRYRWYDNGIWYSTNTATYSGLENGHTYKCAVNLTRGGSSGWRNSTNNVTTAANCINPYPLIYKNVIGTLNLTSFYATYPVNIKVLGGDYKLYTNHNRVVENKTFVFLGGDYTEAGLALVRDTWLTNNVFYGLNFAGTMTTAGEMTDENFATYFLKNGNTAVEVFGYMARSTQAGTVLHIKLGVTLPLAAGLSRATVYANNSVGWDTLATVQRTTQGGLVLSDTYVTTAEDYTNYRIGYITAASGGGPAANFYELEMVNFSSGTISGTPITPASFTPNSFTAEGALYSWNYFDEQSSIAMNFSSAGALTTATLRLYCDGGMSSVSMTNDAIGKNYYLGLKEIPNKLETYMVYDTGDTYYRRWVFCDAYEDFDWYMVNTALTTPRLYTFILTGEYTDWITGKIELEKYIGGNLKSVVSDNWDAAHQTIFYLVDNQEYSITLMQDGCGTSRNIGWVTTNPASTVYTLSVSGTTYDLTHLADIYSHTFFRVYWDEATNQINMTFYDTANRTEWFWWGVYDAYDRSLVYSDNTTSHLYLGTYLANVSKKYYVQMIMSHPDGSIGRWWDGTVIWKGGYFANLDWIGETAGITSETFFMLVALGIVCLTALVGTPLSLPFTGTLVLFEIIVFSVLEWLPFYKNELAMLVLYMIAALVVVVSYNNSKGGK